MKKLTLTTLAVATMLFTLSCGNKSEKETPFETKTEEVTEKVEKPTWKAKLPKQKKAPAK